MYRTGNPDEDKLEQTIAYRAKEAADILKKILNILKEKI